MKAMICKASTMKEEGEIEINTLEDLLSFMRQEGKQQDRLIISLCENSPEDPDQYFSITIYDDYYK